MSSRWKKILADFWGNKGRTLLTIMMIAVGVFAIGFNGNISAYLLESMDTDFLSAHPSEAEIYAGPLNDDSVRIAREVPGVDAVEGRSSTGGKVTDVNGSANDKPVEIRFTLFKDPASQTVNQLKPMNGETTIPLLGERQIIVDGSAAALGYKPGDILRIE